MNNTEGSFLQKLWQKLFDFFQKPSSDNLWSIISQERAEKEELIRKIRELVRQGREELLYLESFSESSLRLRSVAELRALWNQLQNQHQEPAE